ncbi:hypothetical protein J6590_086617, partial [Homalodisca vitripennis]
PGSVRGRLMPEAGSTEVRYYRDRLHVYKFQEVGKARAREGRYVSVAESSKGLRAATSVVMYRICK